MSETRENSDYTYYDAMYFDITEFLTEYEKLPCLWNRTHELFKDRETRAKAEDILSQKLGIMDLKTLRRKIRSVRGTYNTEIRKVKVSLESGNEVYVPKLWWFHLADSFLRVTTDLSSNIVFQLDSNETNTPKKLLQKLPRQKGITMVMLRKAKSNKREIDENNDLNESDECIKKELYNDDSSNFVDTNIENDNHDTSEKIRVYIEDQILAMDEQIEDIDSINESIENLEPPETEHSDDCTSPDYRQKRKRSNSIQRDSKNDTVALAKYLKQFIRSTDNEFLAFGRSIGMQLQKLPIELALQLQMDIQAHITKARLEFLKKNPES